MAGSHHGFLGVLLLSAMTTFVLAARGLGRIFRGLSGLESEHSLKIELLLWEIGLGWSLLSMCFMAFGLAGVLTTGPVWGLIVLLAGLEIRALARSRRFRRDGRFEIPDLEPMEWVALFLVVLLIVFFLVVDQAPPLGEGIGWDGLEYQLPTIQTYVREGRIVAIPDMVYSNYPMGFNILFTPGIMLDQLSFAGLLQFIMGLSGGLMMACLASRHISRMAALWMLPIFFAIPLVQDESTWPMVDLALTFYTVLAVAALIRWHETKHGPFLVLAGLLLGFSCSIKFTSAISVAALGLIFLGLLWSGRPRRLKDYLAPLIAFGIPLLAFGAPWYMKTYATTGNPFLPYLYDVFGGRYWSPQANERFIGNLYNLGLQLPLSIRAGFSLTILSVTSLVLSKAGLQPGLKIPLAFISLWLVFFLSGGPLQKRYLLPISPVVLFLLLWALSVMVVGLRHGYGAITKRRATSNPFSPSWVDRLQQKRLETTVYSIVSLIVLASFIRMFVTKSHLLAVGLGLEDREAFLSRRMYLYKADRFANDHLPDSATVFLFPDCRSVYLEVPFVRGDPLMQTVVDYDQFSTPMELLDALRGLGVTHIMVSYPAYEYYRILLEKEPESVAYTDHAMNLIEGLKGLGTRTLFEANDVTIYALPMMESAQSVIGFDGYLGNSTESVGSAIWTR